MSKKIGFVVKKEHLKEITVTFKRGFFNTSDLDFSYVRIDYAHHFGFPNRYEIETQVVTGNIDLKTGSIFAGNFGYCSNEVAKIVRKTLLNNVHKIRVTLR